MRNFTKKKKYLIILGLIFGFSILFNTKFNYFQDSYYRNLETDNRQKLKRPTYWEINQINIDDTDPTKNWAITEATFGWCSGSGTEGDPYIIENVIINGSNSGNCIYIGYSSEFFIIRNCTVFNSGYGYDGIYLNYVDNGKIINNNCSFNGDHGIFLQGGGNSNIVSNNTVLNNRRAGIDLESFYDYCIISGNIISDNGQDGIILRQDCDNNTIQDNIIYNSGYHGIMLQGGSDNNIVKENLVSSSLYGIRVYGNSNYNKIEKNTISNSYSNGMHIEESQSNIVKNNIIEENLGSGASIDENSFSNFIYLNGFFNNNINAEDNGINNQWDNGTFGNYWDDYSGVDANDDGIGDTPYNISGSTGSQDNFPIFEFPDKVPPVITINTPKVNQVIGFNAPEFNITIKDHSLINTTWYTIDGGTTNYTFSGYTGTINQTAWDNEGTEVIILRFYANDSFGNIGSKDVIIWKDLVAPKIIIISPIPGETFGNTPPDFNISIIEDDLVVSTWYNIESIAGTFPFSGFTGNIHQDAWTDAPEGDITIIFHAIDRAGNIGTKIVTVIKSIPAPPAIPGYNVFLVITAISVLSAIIMRKQKH